MRRFPLTTAEAAREIGVTEYFAKKMLLEIGAEPVTSVVKRKAELWLPADVELLARRHRYGSAEAIVLVHDKLPEHARILRIAGLEVRIGTGILDLLSQHDQEGEPILVLPDKLGYEELGLLGVFADRLQLIVVAENVLNLHVSFNAVGGRLVVQPDELRALVSGAWALVRARSCNIA